MTIFSDENASNHLNLRYCSNNGKMEVNNVFYREKCLSISLGYVAVESSLKLMIKLGNSPFHGYLDNEMKPSHFLQHLRRIYSSAN